MPKVPMYTLAWSSTTQVYELYETRDRGMLGIVPESPAWFAWLDRVSSFAFIGKRGHYTARNEARQRGDRYWSAYLVMGTQLTKKYLGKTVNLTLARLEHIASEVSATQAASQQLRQAVPLPHEQSETQVPSSAAPGAVDAEEEVDSARRHTLAQRSTPINPLLATNLHVPRPQMQLVPRIHLVERLQRGVEGTFTLVSAPAGFGKTTLLAQWLAESAIPAAWLSLEAEDNDPARFLSYLIAALQTLDAQVGTTALAMLRAPQPPMLEAVLAVLISDMTGRGTGEFALVLDDYHTITAEPIQRGMTFLLEHLPPQMHLVLATRADPPLPLARLRAQGQLSEVRTADLRFGTNETSAFLQEIMGLALPPEAIATLEQRTEGWIAGLQLAALSLLGRTDISAFLASFSGSHRYVLDYLSDEVLLQQPAPVQQFLLRTCILERLSGSLCDAVMEQEGSQAMLERLERANLFVVPLDDERGWYRYHHLFAQVLRRHLQQANSTLMPVLHRRASAWYEQHDFPAEAVQHALAIPDVEMAARLIESITPSLTNQGRLFTVLGWMQALPDELIRAHPILCLHQAYLLTITNQLEAGKARLQDAERSAQQMPAEQACTILGHVHAIRGAVAYFSGDTERGIALARQGLALLPEKEVLPRAGPLAITIRAYMVSGDVTPAAEHEAAAAVAFIRTSSNLFSTVSSMTLLARLHALQGRLRQAATIFAQVVQVVPRLEILQIMYSSLFYYFGLGDLLRERNEFDAAERYLVQGMLIVKEPVAVEPLAAILGYTALVRLQQAQGNSREACATLDALAQVAEQRHFPPHLLTQVAAVRARLDLAQGNVVAAVRWADASGLSATDNDLPYPRESEYLALVRVRLAQGRGDPAVPFLQDVLHLLDRLLQEAEAKARMNSVLEILVLRALVLQAQGDQTNALSALERALVLAAPEGYIRLFVDEGGSMLALLRLAYARGIVADYVATLLAAFGEQHAQDFPPLSPLTGTLLEPLTEREREVLRLLLEGASNREIARRLVLSVNTVKRHIYNLCGKLGVQSRTQAIARARTLDLL